MFETEAKLLLGVQPREVMNLAMAVLDLLEQLALNHNWWSNTNLAAIAEAQGAELVKSSGKVANHAHSLRQVIVTLENFEGEVQRTAQRAVPDDPAVRSKLLDVLKPLMNMSQNARRIGNNTLNEAANLARTAPTRLNGVKFEAGARGRASSIVNQLARQGAQILPSNATAAARTVVAEAESLPADEQEAIVATTGAIATMRQIIVMQLRMATAATRAALARWLAPLETMLAFLARVFGGRLTSFVIIPKSILDEMLRQAGVRSDTEA